MHIHVNGKNIEITEAIKAYVKEKIGKVAARYDQIQGIDVVLTVIKNPSAEGKHIAELICKTNSGTIHSEEAAESMYASIDLLADKFARQITKFKDKNISSSKESIRDVFVEADDSAEEEVKAIED
jgi:putative sigma-54 modulation protein